MMSKSLLFQSSEKGGFDFSPSIVQKTADGNITVKYTSNGSDTADQTMISISAAFSSVDVSISWMDMF